MYPGGSLYFTTPISGLESGTDQLTFTLNGLNPHYSSTFSDSYSYEISISKESSDSQDIAIIPSTWSMNLNEKQGNLELSIIKNIQQISITSSPVISISPNEITSLNEGDVQEIEINIVSDEIVEDSIFIKWMEGGSEKQIEIQILYSPPIKEEGINYYSLLGRITGMMSLIALIISIILGGIHKKIRPKINKLINAKTRTAWHCYISWILCLLSLFHGIILLIGPYSKYIWIPEIILGYLTLISMVAVSINGTFMKKIIKIIGSNLWRKTHSYYSYLALILCIIHAVLIGTDFQIIRGFF